MSTRKIGLVNYLAYGSGDFLGAGTTALTAAWLLYFYTTFCGLTPIEATFIFAMARVLDAVVSPLMGYLTDNFGNTWFGKRFGRRKFFILLGIPCVFSYTLMWVGHMNYWYYLFTYLLFDVVYTMILVPYETLVPEMTDDFKQKTKFSGARIALAQLSAILAAFLPGILLSHFGKDNAVSFFYASIVFAVICAIVLTLVWTFTWERPRDEEAEAAKPKLTLGQSLSRLIIELSSTFRIRIFRQHLGMYLGGYIAQDVFNAVFTYYVVFVLMQSPTLASSLMGTMAILQFIAVMGMIPLCIRFGAAPSYRIVVVLFGLAAVSFALLSLAGQSDNMSLLLFISGVAGLGRGGINYIPWNIYTYIADVDEVVTGQRREGIFAGIMTLTRKASQAGAVMLVGIVMQMSGFVSGQSTQVPGVGHTILMILSIGTVLVLSIGFLVSLRFRLNLSTHSVLREETAKMRSAGRLTPESITPQARKTVEMLAGMPYDQLWGNNDIGYINRQKAREAQSHASVI
ncbi:MFS transporter [Phytobacter diazotrophicus]|uniref:MFS transporter n=1 Tax=Phytobacter diazotrophicus TaxID=395631 RepID=UPI00233075D6|nr:MFS transporter [Phytobacter diazotrophicus]MDC0726830.1 MFS transporter [Phytobacter diazotrophicus]MDC0734239.1 MFS transporter [Phytobacter diazotrophicus]